MYLSIICSNYELAECDEEKLCLSFLFVLCNLFSVDCSFEIFIQ